MLNFSSAYVLFSVQQFLFCIFVSFCLVVSTVCYIFNSSCYLELLFRFVAHDSKFQITIQNSREGTSISLALEPVHKAKHINSIDTWLRLSCFCKDIHIPFFTGGPRPYEIWGNYL